MIKCVIFIIFSAIKLQAILNRIEMTFGSASCCCELLGWLKMIRSMSHDSRVVVSGPRGRKVCSAAADDE